MGVSLPTSPIPPMTYVRRYNSYDRGPAPPLSLPVRFFFFGMSLFLFSAQSLIKNGKKNMKKRKFILMQYCDGDCDGEGDDGDEDDSGDHGG